MRWRGPARSPWWRGLSSAHLWDADAGLYLARARVLDPTTGTFLQRDPNSVADSVNLYALLSGDPVNSRDPTGRADPKELETCVARGESLASCPSRSRAQGRCSVVR
ncbi:MAG: RHS repeat-associated core domain-containing protein [Deltaproteobacteria bacterium]|nr:RHS repeat-associated core domain-containing protein [Deltaproteobacteria bacterium]